MSEQELKPCPFCGEKPELPSGDGTQYEIECGGCGQAMASVQICDLMTIEERAADEFTNYRYAEEFVERAKVEAIANWNRRAQPAEAEGVELRSLPAREWAERAPSRNVVLEDEAIATLSAVTAERDALQVENKRLDLMVAQADFNGDMDRKRMMYLLRSAHDCLEQWNMKYPGLARRGEEFSSEHTYRQIRAFVPEYREADAAMAAKEA